MTTKISNITTVINIESTHSGFVFRGTVEIYNNQQAIKKINCRVSKSDADPENPAVPVWYYMVARGCSSEGYMPGSGLPEGELADQILSAGIEFESMLNERIQAGTLNNTITL